MIFRDFSIKVHNFLLARCLAHLEVHPVRVREELQAVRLRRQAEPEDSVKREGARAADQSAGEHALSLS